MNYTKHFFTKKMRVLTQLSEYAPTDNRLLDAPTITHAANPFLSSFCAQVANKDPQKNNLSVGYCLLPFLQSINFSLSKCYASHRYLIKNQEKDISNKITQLEFNHKVLIDSDIIEEYHYSFREFILMLRIMVDQLISLLPENLKNHKCCDSIGGFLSAVKSSKDKYFDNNMKFFVGLNAAANYLKHHAYQFDGPNVELNSNSPLLVIRVDSKKSKWDYQGLEKFFTSEIKYCSEGNIECSIGCDFLVSGFNEFYKKIIQMEPKSNAIESIMD